MSTESIINTSEYDLATCTPTYLAQIDYYVSQSLYGHINTLCSTLLQSDCNNNDYVYWQCYSLIQQHQYDNVYDRLSTLFNNNDYSLPSLSLALQCSNLTRSTHEQLRSDIKLSSKQCSSTALYLAARYFVHVNKLHKAQQCIVKALTKNKKHIGMISLYGLISIKIAESIDNNTADNEILSNNESAEHVLDKGLLTCKKALKCSQTNMDICALISRVNGLTMQKKYDKAIHDIQTTIKIHNTFIPAVELKTQLLCATDQWSDAIVTAQLIIDQYNPQCIAALRVLLSYSVMRSTGDNNKLQQFYHAIQSTEPHSTELINEYNEYKQRIQSLQGNRYDLGSNMGDLSDIVENQADEDKQQSPDLLLRNHSNNTARKQSLVTKTVSPAPSIPSVQTETGKSLVVSSGREPRRQTVNISDATNAVLYAQAQQSSSNTRTAAAANNRVITTPRTSHPIDATTTPMNDTVNSMSSITVQHSNDDVNDWMRKQRELDAAEKLADQQRIEQKRYDELRRLELLDRQRDEQRVIDEQRMIQQQRVAAMKQRQVKEQKVERTVDLDDIPTLDDVDCDQQSIDTNHALPLNRIQNTVTTQQSPSAAETASQRIARNKTLTTDHFVPVNDVNKYGTLQRQSSLQQVDEQSSVDKAENERKLRIALAAQQIESAKQFVKSAFYGEQFIKYGRRGSPHERTLTVEVNGRIITLDWGSDKISSTKDGIKLLDGKQTAVMLNKSARKAKPELCFSLVLADRTLDLECKTMKIKQYWWNGFQLLLKYLK